MGMKQKINILIDRTIKAYTKADAPSLLVSLCKRNPNHRYLWWIIAQIKDVIIYAFWIYLFLSFANTCNPMVLCKPCLDLINTSMPYINTSNFSFMVIK